MKCSRHKKELVKDCNWCGTRICRLCIERKDGLKVYCVKCTQLLGNFKRARIPPVTMLPIPEKKESTKEPTVKKRQFVLNDDGYLILE